MILMKIAIQLQPIRMTIFGISDVFGQIFKKMDLFAFRIARNEFSENTKIPTIPEN